MLHTTFIRLHDRAACQESYRKLGRHLGGIKKYGLDKPIPFSVGFKAGFSTVDIIWALPAAVEPEAEVISHRFASDCAARVLHLYELDHDDDRPRKAIQATRDYARGKITEEQRYAANAASSAAARAAASAASSAAAWAASSAASSDAGRAAAWAASRNVASAAAWAASRAAAGDAASAAAWAASRDVARDAEKQWQRKRLRTYIDNFATRPLPLPKRPLKRRLS